MKVQAGSDVRKYVVYIMVYGISNKEISTYSGELKVADAETVEWLQEIVVEVSQ